MFELSWHHVHVRAESRTFFVRQAESRTLPYLFTFERSREPCPTCLCSSEVENPDTMFMFERSREPCATCLRSSGVENLVYVRAFLTPCLRSSGVENPVLLVYVRAESRTLRSLFMFERSREPCATCLRSSGVENLVYVRAFLTPCLRSSGVENPVLLVYVRAKPRTLPYLFTFERSREPFLFGRRSREPCPTCLRSSGVENPVLLIYVRAESRTFFVRQAESRTPFRIVHQNSIFES
jgi:hypothetical protein